MIELCVAGISAVLEPSTTTRATAEFSGFFCRTTLGTNAAYRRTCDRGCFCVNAGGTITQQDTRALPRHQLHITLVHPTCHLSVPIVEEGALAAREAVATLVVDRAPGLLKLVVPAAAVTMNAWSEYNNKHDNQDTHTM